MPKPKVWMPLFSFFVYPKLTFFGLDKSKAHCFTLHKDTTEQYKQFFDLREGQLQNNIIFLINGEPYPAVIRLVRMNRTKTVKHQKETFPKREVIQFDWRKYETTQFAIQNLLVDAYYSLKNKNKNTEYKVYFYNLEGNIFLLSNQDNDEIKEEIKSYTG